MRTATLLIPLSALLLPIPSAPPAFPACTASGDDGWQVDTVAELRIGTSGNRTGHDLLNVVAATRQSDGSFVVATAGTREIRFFGPDGSWKKSIGGEGAGPGEFSSLSTMIGYRGDSLATWDERQRRITIFDPEGRLGRSVPFDEMYLTLDGATADGAFIMHRLEPLGLESRGGLKDVGIAVFRADPVGRSGPVIARLLGHRTWVGRVEGLMMTAEQPLGPNASITVGDVNVWIGDPATGKIAGGPADATGRPELRALDRATSATRVTPDHVRHARAEYVASLDGELPREIIRGLVAAFEEIEMPPTVPRFGRVLADGVGCVWVQSGDPARGTDWEIFSSDGPRLARVSLPNLDRVLEIGADYLLGTWADEFDVEYVGYFRLRRSAH